MTEETALTVPDVVAPAAPARPYSFAPRSFDEALRFAALVAKSDLCPKDYRGKPESVLIAMQMGAELGLAPMQALQNICVINGRPTVWGDALLAIILVSPVCDYVVESEPDEVEKTKTAWTEAKRRGAVARRVSFTWTDAKKAGLDKKSGPWQEYPNRMMQMRARSFALRDVFPDVLKGLISAEEAGDIVVEASAPPQPPRRLTEKVTVMASGGGTEPVPTPAPAPEPPPPPNGGKKPPTPQETRGVYITNTTTVGDRDGGIAHYEITVKTPAGDDVYVTKDPKVIEQAMSVEGFDHPVVLTWLSGKKEGTKVKILQTLALDEGQSRKEGELFSGDITW